MTDPSRTAILQAQLLDELVHGLLAGRLWTRQQRKDARILVGMLINHSKGMEAANTMNALERKLWDDSGMDRSA